MPTPLIAARRRRPARPAARPERIARDRLRRAATGSSSWPASSRGAGARRRPLRRGDPRGGRPGRPRPGGPGRLQAAPRGRRSPTPTDSSTWSSRLAAALRPGEVARVLRARRAPAADRPSGGWPSGGWPSTGFDAASRGEAGGEPFCPGALRLGDERPNRLRREMDVEGMPLALLVNPASAHGRTLKLLPRLEQALDARRDRLPGRAHARPRGRRRAGAARGRGGRGPGGDQRRRPDRRGRRRPRRLRDAARDRPRRPRQRPRPRARHPRRPRGRRSAVLAAGHTRRIDVGEVNGKRFLGIVSVGFDSDANRLANETRWLRGNLVYAYAGVRTLLGWKPARFTVRVGERAHALHAATRSRSPTAAPSAAACSSPPTPSSTTASSTWSRSARSASCASWLTCRRCSRAPTSRRTRSASSAPRGSS